VLLISMLAVDQAIKYWAQAHLAPGQWSPWPWPGVLELRLTHNQGIAFGLAQGKGGWFTPIALLISFGSAWYSWKHPRDTGWLHTAMALLAAGALGNLYDRVKFGYVRDMFATRFIDFPVFNWADACITVATVILILVWSKEALDAKAHPTRVPVKSGDEPT
jgi:signal peptidase II